MESLSWLLSMNGYIISHTWMDIYIRTRFWWMRSYKPLEKTFVLHTIYNKDIFAEWLIEVDLLDFVSNFQETIFTPKSCCRSCAELGEVVNESRCNKERRFIEAEKKIYEAAVIISEQIALSFLCVFQLLFLNRFCYCCCCCFQN